MAPSLGLKKQTTTASSSLSSLLTMAASSMDTTTTTTTTKFLCSYGGKILPRYPDGKLRYHGGQTRVLAVDRFISFSELMAKLGELCGSSVSLRCQLPTEDLDALVSITSDEDLVNIIEEYDRQATQQQSKPLKIRAFLSLPKRISPPTSSAASASGSSSSTSTVTHEAGSPKSPVSFSYTSRSPVIAAATNRWCFRHLSKPPARLPAPVRYYNKSVAGNKVPYHGYGNSNYSRSSYLVHSGNHWQ